MIYIEIQSINVNFYGSLNKAPAKIGILVMTYKECRILRVGQRLKARDNSAEGVDGQLVFVFKRAKQGEAKQGAKIQSHNRQNE